MMAGALVAIVILGVNARPADTADTILAAARQALGGGKVLSETTSFVLKGTKQTTTYTVKSSASFEILCELPDRFVWKEDAGLRGAMAIGFNGGRVITTTPQSMAASQPITAAVSSAQSAAVIADSDQLLVARIDFAVVTMGLFATSFPSTPLKFTTPRPGAIDMRGRDDFAATMLFDPITHLPDRLGYKVVAPQGAGLQLRQWTYGDYRDVEGRKVPFRVTISVGRDGATQLTQEAEWDVSEVKFNVKIDGREFRSSGGF